MLRKSTVEPVGFELTELQEKAWLKWAQDCWFSGLWVLRVDLVLKERLVNLKYLFTAMIFCLKLDKNRLLTKYYEHSENLKHYLELFDLI